VSRRLEDALQKLREAVGALSSASITDDLTPLANAIALRQVGMTVGTAKEAPDVVVFGDLNRFKSLNDQYGHEVGDVAISYMGQLIDTVFVKGFGCHAFRRSGDEFVLLTTEDRIAYLRAGLKMFAACNFNVNNQVHTVSMSFGLARADGKADFHLLMERAEVACQVAKSQGDGELVEWTEELATQAYRSIRGRCRKCGTKVVCDVPATANSSVNSIRVCPVCEERQM